MKPDRKWILWTTAASAALAMLGALPAAFAAGHGEPPAHDWLLGAFAACTGAWCLLVSTRGHQQDRTRAWCPSVAAMSLAALAPLAVESNLHGAMADGAFLLSVVALAIGSGGGGAIRMAAGAITAGAACAFDATALLWPLGCVWSAFSRQRGQGYAWVMLGGGVTGVMIAWLARWPLLTGHGSPGTVYAIHRDAALLLPVLALGWGGWAVVSRPARISVGEPASLWTPGWASLGVLGLVLVLIGVPLQVRICVLPFWWCMPSGLNDLAQMISDGSGARSLTRWVGRLSWLVVIALSWVGLRRWLDGLLLGAYLLTANG